MSGLPYQDASLSAEARADDLLGRLSTEEKAGQLSQFFYFGNGEVSDETAPGAEAALEQGGAGSLLFVIDPALHNRLQRKAIAGSRWGIPLIFGYDVIHGLRTILPVPIALAASWCPEIVEEGQAVAAREARAVGVSWTFAPMVDITSDARWGRIIEGAGEDPVLGAAVAAAQVRGFQGPQIGADDHVIAGPKHFAGYGAARGGRDYEDADISDAELHNIYLPPFRAAIEAGAGNVMGAYMDLNGVPASGNRWLLTDILRGEFGFDGWVVSDANAVRSLEVQHFARDLTAAAVRALTAGLDMEMCMFDPAFSRLPDAIASGLVDEAALNQAVRRVLLAKFRMGLFEDPYVDEAAAPQVLADPAHREVARRAAEKTFVLLKNDGLLPLAGQRRITVIGQLADAPRDILGPWVFDHDIEETVTILDGIRARAGAGVEVEYAPGVRPGTRVFGSMFDRMDHGLPVVAEDFDDDAELARAVELARGAEVAVVVIGQSQNMIGEKASTSTLDLPGRQLELLQSVVATGTPTVALVMSGRPLDLRWAAEHVPSILQIWYPGTRGGDAVASVLFGDVAPGGKLPFTWPRTVGQVPMVYSHYRTFQPEEADQRYWDEESTPLFGFGHGLSYASFAYGQPSLEPDEIGRGETATVSVEVTNTSTVEADEVVQLYIHQRYGTSSRPIRELKGFQRVTLAAGETRTLSFELGPEQLRYWSAVPRDWVQDATEIDIWVGGSSAVTEAAPGAVLSVH